MKYRYLYDSIEEHLYHKNYTILTGARQDGKTTLLRKLYSTLKEKNEIVAFINLENKILLSSLNKTQMQFLIALQRLLKRYFMANLTKGFIY